MERNLDETSTDTKPEWRSRWLAYSDPAVTALVWSGIALIVLGVIHIPVLLATGGAWEGSVSWRKPILFGVSTGMTLWSLGWVANAFRVSRLDRAIATVVAVTLVVEVGLITLQQWLGRASHFNRETEFDASVDVAMLILISIAFSGVVYFSVRCFSRLQMDADYRLAARAGMLFLVASCVVGFVISIHGYQQIEQGIEPGIVGRRGVAKFPHGVAIHALQLLPLIAFSLRCFGVPEASRMRLVLAATMSLFLQLVFAVYQTVSGLGRFEPGNHVGRLILLAAILVFAIPAASLVITQFCSHMGRIKQDQRTPR